MGCNIPQVIDVDGSVVVVTNPTNCAEISKELREAYSGLLSLPAPKTDADYRRAVLMAVLIGREIECQLSAKTNQ